MAMGELLRQARLEAGLSQRQLCGQVITRNMLSQIENGSARPSMDTLRYLAEQLGKPVSYFLEEEAQPLPNLALMEQLRRVSGKQALDLLEHYQGPDSIFDPERYLREAITCLDAAEAALKSGKDLYARQLLDQAAKAGQQTDLYTPELERRRLLLLGPTGEAVVYRLPSLDDELLLRAEDALKTQNLELAAALLDSMHQHTDRWYCLRGQVYRLQENYPQAVEMYLHAAPSKEVYAALECCYRDMRDFEKAYAYACAQR